MCKFLSCLMTPGVMNNHGIVYVSKRLCWLCEGILLMLESK